MSVSTKNKSRAAKVIGLSVDKSAENTDSANTKSNVVKVIILPSGKKAEIIDFKGKHIREASAMAGDDASAVVFAMIAICCTIDGEGIVLEDLDDMPGKDVLKLQKEFSDVNF